MDRFPCELIQHIFMYIDQPVNLDRLSFVCSRWKSFIKYDEVFLNRWFSRSLKHSQKSFSSRSIFHVDCPSPENLNTGELVYPDGHPLNFHYFMEWLKNMDQSLFPDKLRSSECDFLPWYVSRRSSDYKTLYEYNYRLSLCDSPLSFSFWLFLLPQCESYIQMGDSYDNGLEIFLSSDDTYHYDNGESISICNRWIHIVLNKTDTQSNHRVYIDGQHVTELKQTQITLKELTKHYSTFNLLLCRKHVDNPSEISSQVRIADLNALTRCLTLLEIRAIHQQQASVEQVKVGTYIKTNEI